VRRFGIRAVVAEAQISAALKQVDEEGRAAGDAVRDRPVAKHTM